MLDAEFEGWSPPPEYRKAAVVAIIALPRALNDNRIRRMVGMDPIAGGELPEQRRAELAAARQQQAAPAPQPQPPPQPAPAPQPQQAAPAPQAAAAPAPTLPPTQPPRPPHPVGGVFDRPVKVPQGFA